MIIDKSTWHARVYFWWARQKDLYAPKQAGLCLYVRVVLLYAWLRALFISGGRTKKIVVWTALGALVEYGLYRVGRWEPLVIQLEIIGFAIIGGLGCAFIQFIMPHKRGVSFVRVLGEWWRGVHEHICPVVHFDREEHANGNADDD